MIAFISWNSNWVLLLEGLYSSNPCRFFSRKRHTVTKCRTDWRLARQLYTNFFSDLQIKNYFTHTFCSFLILSAYKFLTVVHTNLAGGVSSPSPTWREALFKIKSISTNTVQQKPFSHIFYYQNPKWTVSVKISVKSTQIYVLHQSIHRNRQWNTLWQTSIYKIRPC